MIKVLNGIPVATIYIIKAVNGL